MMTAEGNGGAGSPRSDLSESQHWEVIGPDFHSGDGHFVVPKALDPSEDSSLILYAATERSREETDIEIESAPLHPALRHVRCGTEDDLVHSEEAQKRWAQTEKYAADLRKASSASPPKMRAKYTSRCFKILVAGAPGTGKTTFIQNLASAYGSQDDGAAAMAHSQSTEGLVESFSIEPTAFEDFTEGPDSLCTRVLLTDEAAKVHYTIFIQDTPGIYEEGPVADSVAKFIKEGNEEYMAFEQTPTRQVPMSSFTDTRVDICLYFIAPHTLLPVDIATVKKLGKMVPIVPVISKGDAMTKQELQHFKQHISKALGIGSPSSCVYTFLPEDIQEAGLDSVTQVFSVISSCIVDESVGRHWPVRSYPWGIAEALSSSHSDLPALKRLLIELSFDDIKACTESSYHNFRKEQLSLCLEGRAFIEPKDAFTHTGESHLVADSAHVESSGPADSADTSQPEKTEIVSSTDDAAAKEHESYPQQMPAMDKPAKSQSKNAPNTAFGATHAPSRGHKLKQASQSMDRETVCGIAALVIVLLALCAFGVFIRFVFANAERHRIVVEREAMKQLDREAEHIAKHLHKDRMIELDMEALYALLLSRATELSHKGCMPELDMEALYASLPSRNRELWALIRLTEAMAQTEGGSMAVCAQERGALAYQASLARAEMAAQEAGHIGRLRAEIRSAAQKKAEQIRATATRFAAHAKQRLDQSVHRLSSKMPIKTEKGNLNIDMKALGRILWRSTIFHIFR